MPLRTADQSTDRWEVGSEFHWDPADHRVSGNRSLPATVATYASGTGALRGLLRLLGHGRTVHLPSFFCQDVVDALSAEMTVDRYTELPDGRGPDPASLRARPGDVVLRVNLFGRGRDVPRLRWLPEGTVLVEDHTHDPLSPWARRSTADYAVASLRKYLPLPDGALLWSPTGNALPAAPTRIEPAAEEKLRAMRIKAAWLRGADVDKESFRALQRSAENAICQGVTAMSVFSLRTLTRLPTHHMRAQRIRNASRLTVALADLPAVQMLPAPPLGGAPFGVQLVLPGAEERDRLRYQLESRRIYAAVHWPLPGGGPAAETSARLLTLPVDHRYVDADIDRVAAAVRAAAADLAAPDRQPKSFSCSSRNESINRPGGSVTSS